MTQLHHNAKNLTGQKFGRLTISGATDKRKNGYIIWRCICSCGNEVFVSTRHLKNGDSRSCGCLQKEIVAKQMTTHGMWGTPIYSVWNGMIQRCENPKDTDYKYYGDRGIKVCERWHTFENFYADVGDPPEEMTLDRWPDNDGNYEPNNWRWATRSQQNKNRRPISC